MANKKHLQYETLDVERFIKTNNLQQITNPIYFASNGLPTADGFLSNEIFGISKDQRANVFAYVDLYSWFIDPLSYKIWTRMNSKIRECVHGTKNFVIDSEGQLVEDPSGDNGVDFLRKNIDKIKIKSTDSLKRDINIDFLMNNKKKGTLFLNKYPIIPAYYRDVNSANKSVGVGDINKLYNSVLIASTALKETAEFGFSMTGATSGRIQELLVEIYNWFTKEPNLGRKVGIIRRAVLSKTADYSSRLVISAPDLNIEAVDDLMVDPKHCALPLASAIANLFPYILFWCRRFFDNEFSGMSEKVMYDKDGNAKLVYVKDPYVQFSDEVIKKYMKRFIKAYSNRLIPIEVELTTGEIRYMNFKGNNTMSTEKKDDIQDASSIFNRRLTWCDLFYMAAVEMCKDKHVIITRYPLNDYFGQTPQKIRIASMTETEKVFINNAFYPYYPKIREEDINSNTSNKFKDTLCLCNSLLAIMGGDYDGDQVSAKVAFTIEANKELDDYLNSNKFYIDLGGSPVREAGKEAIQSLYNLTLILPETKDKIKPVKIA